MRDNEIGVLTMQTRTFAFIGLSLIAVSAPAAAQRIDPGVTWAPRVDMPQMGGQIGVPQIGGPQVGQPWGGQAGQNWNGQGWNGPVNQGWNGQVNPGWNGQVNPGWNGQVDQGWNGQGNQRWIGGQQAPGGWNAYRRPSRGWRVPNYWMAPSFGIANFSAFGLAPPPNGFGWSRYYDDAVLIDRSGRVNDWVGGLDWNRNNAGFDNGHTGVYPAQPQIGTVYPQPGAGYQGTYSGTYRVGNRTGYQTGVQSGVYQPPVAAFSPQVAVPPQVYNQSYSTQGFAGQGYYADGYGYGAGYGMGTNVNGVWYPGGTTTTIVVQSAPVVTTTVTEYIEETVYTAPVRRHRAPVRKWRPRARPCCCR